MKEDKEDVVHGTSVETGPNIPQPIAEDNGNPNLEESETIQQGLPIPFPSQDSPSSMNNSVISACSLL